MKRVIHVGDPTERGGQVPTANAPCLVRGRPVARIGDKGPCPREGRDDGTIIEGDPAPPADGIPGAFEGCPTDCGAVLEADGIEWREQFRPAALRPGTAR